MAGSDDITGDEPESVIGAADGPHGRAVGLSGEIGVPPPATRRRWLPKKRWIGSAALVVLVVVGVRAYQVWRDNFTVADRYKHVAYDVPRAPHLVARNGQTVYRIDPTRSQLSYRVAEKIAGATASHATGTTHGVAGDVAVDPKNPAASRVGTIVANVEQFHSDKDLRDARIRKDFLESARYPLATFKVSRLSGLPASLSQGRTYRFTMAGTAKVKATTAPVRWNVTAKLTNGELHATAVAHIKLSTFDAGPISIAGLVSTSDDATLTFTLTAVDPSKHAVPTQISVPAGVKPHGASPSFSKTIQPMLEQNCASCHAKGQVGAEHWQLERAGDAADIAAGIGTVTKARYMPPWPASSKGVPLVHVKTLSPKQIDEFARWAEAGGKLDVPRSTPVKPDVHHSGVHPRHDQVLRLPKPYEGSKSVPNDYRCFPLDPKLTQTRYLTGYEFLGDQLREIHHVQVFRIPAALVGRATARDGSDGKPGYSCYAGPTGVGQSGLIAGWVPGQDPVIYGYHAGIKMNPGDIFVMQVHYHHDDEAPTPDRSGIALQWDKPSAQTRPIDIVNPLGPVEIPCMPGTKARLCDRNAALAYNAKAYGPIGSYAEPGLLGLCHRTVQELVANFHDGVAHTTCDSRVRESGTMIAAMGHMHTLGKSFRLTLDPGTPRQKILLDIPTWNFDWQMNYGFVHPIHVKAGETVRMQCTWDRSLDPNRAPKYIVFAEGTEDEMCFSTYALIPDQRND